MEGTNKFEIIIVGGSYAGLSAAMALGRSLRKVLVIDSGKPCNAQTPHSHNFLTQDGQAPGEIAAIAKGQVEKYDSVQFYDGLAVQGKKIDEGFEIFTQRGDTFTAKRIIFATGLKDIMPDIPGYSDCWGISILHCPYCHGYEVRHQKTAILANGEHANHYAELISHWTNDLVILTNGKSTLTSEQTQKIRSHGIDIIETEIQSLEHKKGKIQNVIFKDGSRVDITAIYSSPENVQHCNIPEQLGCEFAEEGLISVDMFQKTSVEGVYACGDNSGLRAVSIAVSSGSVAGIVANKDLISEGF
ncbi:MAG: NAD(P)/FAD-dependent oxidoreductase [Reichenbachiella sp.]|uniref:NAD(P)/FAD-dependent oxidoreductase n=1 Tax=Reichenbachiella sp. TaxID=2184521 RepID=UPI003296C384